MRIDKHDRRPYETVHPKFEQECQTNIDFEMFDELEDAHELYLEQKEMNKDL